MEQTKKSENISYISTDIPIYTPLLTPSPEQNCYCNVFECICRLLACLFGM